MWMFIFLLTFVQGISTYLISISIAQTDINCGSINKILKDISPYTLLDKYTPDQLFTNAIISIISRILLFVTGFIGIILCVIIHDIYYRISKICINRNKFPKLPGYKKSNFMEIDIIIESVLATSGLNINNIANYLAKNNIIWRYLQYLIIDKNAKPEDRENFCYDVDMIDVSIDEAIFRFNKSFKKKSKHTICICLENDNYKSSIFKHLCIPVSIENIDKLNTEEFQKSIADKIIELVK